MNNWDTDAAWHYHNGTKHPNGYLMDPRHAYDPMHNPMPFKNYADLEPIPLPHDAARPDVPALSAISTAVEPAGEDQVPDMQTLASVLLFSAGITKKIAYPWGDIQFRAAACTGALYHIELYLVCGDLPGLEAGVYHFDPKELGLRRLRGGDCRRDLIVASGNEPSISSAPAVIVYTDVFWRNAVKYQAREYRHAFWDSGTILANTLAVSSAHGLPARLVAGFLDEQVNRLLDLDTQREAALALVPLGYAPEMTVVASPSVTPLGLKTVPVSDYELDFPAILEMHEASSLAAVEEVASWRSQAPPMAMPSPSGRLIPLEPYTGQEMPQDPIDRVIVRRGSARRFAQEPIAFRELSTALEKATQGTPADFLEPPGATLSHIYLIVNAVDGLHSGLYVLHRDRQALELIEEGDFRHEAGHLALGQALAADASVDVYFMSDLGFVLERFGNRGYRAAQLDASIAAGKLYLAAYAQRLGATGLTFFDDAVTDFFSPHAQGKSVMFLVALGRRARRR